MKKVMIFFIVLAIVLFAFNANSLVISSSECKNDGSAVITFKADNRSKIYTEDMTLYHGETKIKGTWDSEFLRLTSNSETKYAVFGSNENIFNEHAIYPLSADYELTLNDKSKEHQSIGFEITCPGLVFTCKQLNISIDSCFTQGGVFRAYLKIKGLEQSNGAKLNALEVTKFTLETENKYKDIDNFITDKGNLPEGYIFLRLRKGEYILKHIFEEENAVKYLWVGFNNELKFQCPESQNPEVSYYNYKGCDMEKLVEETPEVVAEEEEKLPDEEDTVTKGLESYAIKEGLPKEEFKEQSFKPLMTLGIGLVFVLLISGFALYYLHDRGYL